MSGDARDFNNIATRAVIKLFFPLQGKAPKEIYAILKETLGEHEPSYATVKNWVLQFKRGDFSNCDTPHPGRPKTVTTPEFMDQIHELILEDRRISAKSIAEQLDISRGGVGSIVLEDFDMRKVSANWVPKWLNADQKRQRCQYLEHPPYFPDLAPSDYHLFPGLKKQLKGRHFSSDGEVTAATETWLDGQHSDFFFF